MSRPTETDPDSTGPLHDSVTPVPDADEPAPRINGPVTLIVLAVCVMLWVAFAASTF